MLYTLVIITLAVYLLWAKVFKMYYTYWFYIR